MSRKVAITGLYCSGKSSTLQYLRSKKGAHCLSADVIASEILQNDEKVKKEVLNLLGSEILNEKDQSLKKGEIAKKVFSDLELLARMETIIHPRVIERIKSEYRSLRNDNCSQLFIVECPILYEIGFDKWFDHVLFLDAPQKERLQRAVERSGSLAVESQLKVSDARHWPAQKMKKCADYVVSTNQEIEQTYKELDKFIKRILSSES